MRGRRHEGIGRLLMVAAVALVAVLATATAASAQAPAAPPPPDGAVIGAPPPPLRGGKPGHPLPCGLVGRLNDGRAFAPSHGTIRAAMIFVDFSDAPADWSATPQSLYDNYVPAARQAFRAISYGQFGLSVTPLLKWVRMPRPLSDYGFLGYTNAVDYKTHHGYIADAVKAADPSIAFSKFSTVYVVAAPSAPVAAAADPAEYAGEGFFADGREISHAVTIRTDNDYYRNPNEVVHETGHLLGLPDLYPYTAGVPYVGEWDVMSQTGVPDTPMTSWSRLLVGWLHKKDFGCISRSSVPTLTPVARPGGLKAVVAPIDSKTAYVAEARADELGAQCQRDGVLLYTVHTDAPTGAGPLRVIDAMSSGDGCAEHSNATFIPGVEGSRYESADGRFGLTVLGRAGNGFRVRVTVPPRACKVPVLRGKTLAAARRLLASANCALGKVRRPRGRHTGGLVVVTQSVRAGASRANGARVDVRLGAPPKSAAGVHSHSLRRVAATG